MSNMIEDWKDIPGYEGLYVVSNNGRVMNVRSGRVLKVFDNYLGYKIVSLCRSGKQKTFSVHRLVAEAFIKNPDNLREVNHKDEDKSNNNVDNLEWCDRKYNVNYGSRMDKVRKTKEMSGYWTGVSKTKDYHKKYWQENKYRYRKKNE